MGRIDWDGTFPDEFADFKAYLEKYGYIVKNDDRVTLFDWKGDVIPWEYGEGWSWYRKHPYVYEYNFLNHNDLEKMEKSWLSKQMDEALRGKLPDPTIEEYNMLAKMDEWYGGYVQELGFVSQAASSLYGTPIYNNSWIQRGEPDNPVSVGQFYSLKSKDLWHGGFVDGWDYVSDSRTILGSSSGELQVVNEGESFIGAIVNISTLITYGGLNYDSTKNTFAEYYDKDKKKYLIPSNKLSSILNKYFIATEVDDFESIHNALSKHTPVFVRQITEKITLSNGDETSYGEDGLVVDMNIRKNEITILNAVNFQVYTVKYYYMRSDNYLFFILERQ